jgi:hypothetical protein
MKELEAESWSKGYRLVKDSKLESVIRIWNYEDS